MALRIEDYALIGNMHTAALVGRDGSIDWLCVPRFDSGACFAALLGTPENGRWLIAPKGEIRSSHRAYRADTLVLETVFETADGTVALVDFMPISERPGQVDVIRLVQGRGGAVPMRMEMVLRFDYGHVVPWVRRFEDGIRAIGGPDAVLLQSPVVTEGRDLKTLAEFTVRQGETVPFTLIRNDSHLPAPRPRDPIRLRYDTEAWWERWAARCTYQGPWRSQVMRSLVTLKALIYQPTGAIVAAPTTSLPEAIGGVRNWDYRYCWLRDATFTLYALLISGYGEEAVAWREWLLRAVAGEPHELQIMYGLAGERRLPEFEVEWLPGYERSRPVRVGNAAHSQFQLDVYGELTDTMYVARKYHIRPEEEAWQKETVLLEFLEDAWKEPDEGIWEVRGGRRHFTHSKVMAWVAFDRAVKAIERHGLAGPVERWRACRDRIHTDVLANGFDPKRGAFVQYYGASGLDAACLLIPLIGFLPAADPRVVGTVEAIRRELVEDGLVRRYGEAGGVDGLPPGEGAFLPCTFWLADCLAAMGREEEARAIFERLVGLCNDVGLLSEEYDARSGRLVGNFPQAFSHISLVNTAYNLSIAHGPARHRCH